MERKPEYALVHILITPGDPLKFEPSQQSVNTIGLFRWFTDAQTAMVGFLTNGNPGTTYGILDLASGRIGSETTVPTPVEPQPEPYDGVPADTRSI